jgi:hypothetical protein
VYGTFATVIGLLAWFALQAQITLYAVEIDVVRSRRLRPRSLLNPPLTLADESALRSYAQAQARVEQEEIAVQFGPAAQAPDSTDQSGGAPRDRRGADSRATLVVTAVAGAAAGLALARLRGGSSRRG